MTRGSPGLGMTISMTKLSAQFADLGIPTIFPPGSSSNGLSETVSKLGRTQCRSPALSRRGD